MTRHEQYAIWLDDLMTLPGEEVKRLDTSQIIFMDEVIDVPEFDKDKTLKNLGITEKTFNPRDISGGEIAAETHGYSTNEYISIRRNATYYTKTVWHELGHILCDHVERFGELGITARHQAEAEAEAVAYLLCNVFKHYAPKAQSRGYVQGWYPGKKISAESAKYIMGSVDKIIKANGYAPEIGG